MVLVLVVLVLVVLVAFVVVEVVAGFETSIEDVVGDTEEFVALMEDEVGHGSL